MRWLALFLLMLTAVPALAEEDGVAQTRQRVIGIWSPSRGYYNYTGGNTPEAGDYHIITKVLPDGTWTSSDFRQGTWAVEEENWIIMDPHTLKERLYKLQFVDDEMVRKGPYNRDGKLTHGGHSYTYFEYVKKEAEPTPK